MGTTGRKTIYSTVESISIETNPEKIFNSGKKIHDLCKPIKIILSDVKISFEKIIDV